jgi:hypothetical protein
VQNFKSHVYGQASAECAAGSWHKRCKLQQRMLQPQAAARASACLACCVQVFFTAASLPCSLAAVAVAERARVSGTRSIRKVRANPTV